MNDTTSARASVHHYYARYLVHPSGVTDSLDHWVQALTMGGVPTDVLCAPVSDRTQGNEFADADHTRPILHLGWSRKTWVPIGLISRLRRGDTLVLHEGWVLSNVIAAGIAVMKSVRYIVVPHGVYERGIVDAMSDRTGLRTRLERWVLRRASAVHVFYRGEQTVVTAFESRIRRFITVANGAPQPEAATRWTGDGDYFLWIGRFDPHHKGLDNLLRFWAGLTEPRPRLVLAGPDFLHGRQTVRALMKDLDLTESVEVRGRVSGAEKVDLMTHARAYLHPSRWESCSIMLLEMLSAGSPSLISTTIHAASELEPIGVVRSVDFSSPAVSPDAALAAVDRDLELSRTSAAWASTSGSWNVVGPEYVHQVQALALKEISA